MKAVVKVHNQVRAQFPEWVRLLRKTYGPKQGVGPSLWKKFVQELAETGGDLSRIRAFHHPKRPNEFWCRLPPDSMALVEVKRPKWWQVWKPTTLIVQKLNFSPGRPG